MVAHFGTIGDTGIDPLSPADQSDYHTAFDRTLAGPNIWNLGPPNGGISILDIVLTVAQFGHDCG